MANQNCNSCYYCNSCDSCNSCYSCYYCDSCDSCYSCNSCYSCYYCNSCDSCYYCNSCDSCYSCRGLRMSEYMIFCLGEGRTERKGEGYQKNHCVFNQQLEEKEWDEIKATLPTIKIKLVEYNDGKWTTRSYEEAWALWWDEASQEDKDAILDIKYFSWDIFTGITGIKKQVVKSKAKKVELSLDEIADKFDIPVKNLKIKK